MLNENEIIQALSNVSTNLEKISNALFLNSLMDYREKNEEKITKILKSDAKKAVWDLCNGKYNVSEIAEKLNKSHPTISEHLKLMFDEKVVFKKQNGNENNPVSIDALIELILTSSLQ